MTGTPRDGRARTFPARKAARILLWTLALAGGFSLVFYSLQRKMIYHPWPDLVAAPDRAGLAYEDVFLDVEDGIVIHGWYVPAPGARTTLLFLHGNAGNISHRLDNVRRLHEQGLNVFIIDYRGYGRSSGSPHEQGLYRDARASLAYLQGRPDVRPDRIAVFGRSLGGAVAVDLCSRESCSKLILESTFTSTADMARSIFPFFPLARLLTERFDSESKIRGIGADWETPQPTHVH